MQEICTINATRCLFCSHRHEKSIIIFAMYLENLYDCHLPEIIRSISAYEFLIQALGTI